jgi:hypothetical protein
LKLLMAFGSRLDPVLSGMNNTPASGTTPEV